MTVLVTPLSAEIQQGSTTSSIVSPALAKIPGGYVVATSFYNSALSSWEIFEQRFLTDGTPVAARTKVNPVNATSGSGVAAAGIPGGGYVVAYTGASTADLHFRIYDQNGVPGAVIQANTSGISSEWEPDIAMRPDGSFAVTWRSAFRESGSDSGGIYTRVYDKTGAPLTAELHVNATTASSQQEPSAKTLADGSFLFTWATENANNSGVYTSITMRKMSAAGVFAAETVVPLSGVLAGQFSDVQPLADGGWIVLYAEYSGNDANIKQLRYAADGTQSGPSSIVSVTASGVNDIAPSVTALADGGWVVTWQADIDGDGFAIAGQRFGSSGARVGDVFVVNDTTQGWQWEPEITATDDGGFVVGWYGEKAGGGYEIRTRNFGPAVVDGALTSATEMAQGSTGADLFLANPGALGAGDVITGGAGTDELKLTSSGQLNIASVKTFTGIEKITGSAGDDQIKMQASQLAGVTQIDGGDGQDSLLLTGAANLLSVALTGVEHVSAASGTAASVRVDTPQQAVLVDGSGGGDVTVDASFMRLNVQDRATLFTQGVDRIFAEGNVTFHSDGTVTARTALTNSHSGGAQQSDMSALTDGGFIYAKQGTSTGAIFLHRHDAEGAEVGTGITYGTGLTDYPQQIRAQGMSNGDYVVAWYGVVAGTPTVYAQRFNADGSTDGARITVASVTGASYVRTIDVAQRSDGGFAITWNGVNSNGNFLGAFGRSYTSTGATAGAQFQLGTTTSDVEPDVHSLPGGGFVATWWNYNTQTILAQKFTATGAAQGAPFTVAAGAGLDIREPGVSALADGGLAVAWGASSPAAVMMQRYDASGVAIGAATVVATGSGASQPDVLATADGGWVVTFGASYQRYDASGAPIGVAQNFGGGDLVALSNGRLVGTSQFGGFDMLNAPADYTVLTSGGDTVNGGSGTTIVVADSSALGAGDALSGGGGTDFLEFAVPGVFDLTSPASFTGFEVVLGSNGNDTLVVSAARLAGVQVIDLGAGADDAVVTSEAALNLNSQTFVGVERISSTAVGGTTFTVNSVAKALLVAGPGARVSTTLTFTAAERDAIFARGVERITDASGTYGGTGVSVLVGGAGVDKLNGGDGDDIITGGAGADILDGGPGNDSLDYSGEGGGGAVTVNLGAGTATDTFGATDTISNFEYVRGAGGADTLIGDGAANVLAGGGGADSMQGGGGDDVYEVTEVGDQVTETAGQGYDTVFAYVDYALGSEVEVLSLQGAAVAGTGNGLDNRLYGNALGNVLTGGGGIDLMVGGAGDDTYDATESGDYVLEFAGEGVDTVISHVDAYALSANVEKLVLGGGATVGIGNGLANTLTGNGVANILVGGAGDDLMIGGAGDDIYEVDSLGDVVTEAAGEGTDAIFALVDGYTLGAGVETLVLAGSALTGFGDANANNLIGNGLANTLDGGGGIDFLTAGDGADRLIGGSGDDVMIGGNGADTIVWTGTGVGRDIVLDLNAAEDRIEVSSSMFADFAAVQAKAFQAGSDTVIAYDSDTLLVLKNTTLANLTASNFVFNAGASGGEPQDFGAEDAIGSDTLTASEGLGLPLQSWAHALADGHHWIV